jgi:hypothetical protein
MSGSTRGALGFLLLLLAVQSQGQQRIAKKDWDLTQAYTDVFKILSDQNTCSSFYGGPRVAITVLNELFSVVKAQPLSRDISFQMVGRPRLLRDKVTGTRYRVFDTAMVNTQGSFYQRRVGAMEKFPSDVGNFGPGTRRARALIVLHELGHLIENEDGTWLLPDDGLNGWLSKVNTLRVQQACHAELAALK